MDWLRISLIILGIILIAGIWMAHRIHLSGRRRFDDIRRDSWEEDDVVRIHARGSDNDLEPVVSVSSRESSAAAVAPETPDPVPPEEPSADKTPRQSPSGPVHPPHTEPVQESVPPSASQKTPAGPSFWKRFRSRSAATPTPSSAPSEDAERAQAMGPAVFEGAFPGEYDFVSAPRVIGKNPLAEPGENSKILILRIVAPTHRPFTGVAIESALKRAGLRFGKFSIYHFHDPEDGRILFSVTNMVAPGTLSEQDLADLSTPGINLFLQVHTLHSPHRAFESWLEQTHALAKDLGGKILDSQQSTATNQTLAHLREEMNQWLLHHRRDLLRKKL